MGLFVSNNQQAKVDSKIEPIDINIAELFTKLQVALKTKQPLKCKPVIQELDRYILSEDDEIVFSKVKSFVKVYKFKEAIEIMERL